MGDSSVHSARTSVSKASEDCRSPKPGGILPHVRSRESVLDCGCPLPLWNGALTNPTRTETFNASPHGELDIRPARTSVSKASADCRSPKPGGIPPAAREVAKAFWTAVAPYRFGMGREQTQRAPIRSTPVSCESSTSIRLARLSPKRQRTAAVQNLAEFPPPRETPRSCQTRLAQPKFAAGRDWCSGWRGPDHSFRVHPIILYKFILSDPTLTF